MSNATRSGSGNDTQSNTGTSKTTFGRSAESQAQIRDAAAAAGTNRQEILNVYRLVAVAALDDPIWQGAPPAGELVVAARTAGDARIVASGAETDFTDLAAAPADDVSTRSASLFRNEKAYTVIEIERGRSGMRRGVIPKGALHPKL